MSRIATFVLLSATVLLVAANHSAAQATPVPPTGIPPFGTFNHDAIDTVNIGNLNIHFEFPVFAKKGRGLDFYANVVHDNILYIPVAGTLITTWDPASYRPSTWNLSAPLMDAVTHDAPDQQTVCNFNGNQYYTYIFNNFVYMDPHQTPHMFNGGVVIGYACYSTHTATGTSSDGLYTLFVSCDPNTGQLTSETVTDTAGNIRNMLVWPQPLTDPNGNQITYSSSGVWTDTTGNTVLTTNPSQNGGPWSYPSPSGGITETVTTTITALTLKTAFQCPGIADLNEPVSLTTGIGLPDGTSYSIVYESTTGSYPSTQTTGRVHSITLPSGVTITYTYTGGTNGINCKDGSPAILTKQTPDGQWTYNRFFTGSGTGYWTTVVTDPTGSDTVYTFGGEISTVPAAVGLEGQRKIYQGSRTTGTLLETITTCYNGNSANCPTAFVGSPFSRKDVYTYIGTSQPSLSETFYNGASLVTLDNEFDFGVSTPPTKSTMTTYASLGAIKNRPSCIEVSNGSAPTSCGLIDQVNTKSVTKYSNYDSHGNAGTIQNWVSSGTYLSRSFTYFPSGLVQTAKDANGNTTSYTYGDCNGSYLTLASMPLSLSTSMTWDCNGGVPLTSSDENSQPTTYVYNDPFWRITEVDYPDGGKTTTTYNDTGSPQTIVQNQLIKAGVNLTTQTTLDGLGRTTQTAITSDPEGADYTDMTYDGAGRLATKSNPHRSGSSSTDGTTQYFYDALGRTTQITPSDGSIATTTYSNNCSTSTDEAGKARTSCVDWLGRVTAVWEDPSGSNYETDYTYDAVGNLTAVTQKGGSTSGNWRNRSFVYDGLSRLLSATNPESGAVSYSYDANGNLLTKTSPAANQTSSSVTQTISYCYDALNRVISKWYTTPTCTQSSPIGNYFYDQASYNGLTITYGLGRRTGMSDVSGATAWSYDKMGRLLTKRQTIGTFTKTTGHTYNLDGSISTISNPGVGRVMTYTMNAADRITAVQNTGGSINFLQTAHYAPFGGLTSATESSAAITVTNSYNKRLQPALISASSTSGTILSLCHDFHLLGGLNLSPCVFSGTSPGNNGNIYQVANNRDGNRTQNFSYDSLSRVQQAYTNGNSPLSTSWGETFTIDAWGNLTNRGPVTGKKNYEGLNCPANTLNQLTTCSLTYDAAGNMMANGSATYTYDAENRLITAGGYNYTYDGDGQRVKKTNGSTGTLYYSDMDGKVLNESSLGATNLREYVYLNSERIARIDVPTPLTVKYYFSDNLGSASVITDANGTMPPLEESDYYPYGGELVITNGDSNTYKFTGKERDSESTLDNLGFRYFGSSLGRFMSPDDDSGQAQDNPQSWNLYSYVMNRATAAIDPDGHDCIYSNGDGTGSVKRGDCFSDTDNGVFVNGTINLKSFQYNAANNSSSFSYTPEDGAIAGKGFLQGPTLAGGASSMDVQIMASMVPGGSSLLAFNKFAGNVLKALTPCAGLQNVGCGVVSPLEGGGLEGSESAAGQVAVDVDNLTNKIVRQMTTRGWTKEEILDTVRAGKAFPVVNKATGGAATEYVSASGKFVVVDNATGQVIQVSGPGFLPNHLVK